MEEIQSVKEEALQKIAEAGDLDTLQQLRVSYLGKKGSVQQLMAVMKTLPREEKPAFGQQVNQVKKEITDALGARMEQVQKEAVAKRLEAEKIDITLAGEDMERGTVHPLMMIQQELEDLFIGMGYKVAEGPEVEQDYYNFELANLPKDHPARDMQDTF
ncbi:MAG: phenylalanine--tRNA ligase subunit alpha, partial [Lactimicrobium massiliense]|nr:phenylalanine--tRNA ligase subunit alpha [Lactimicrobium massiliense]